MSQAPSMPMFVDAMLADTMHLTTEEFGAYHFILYATWRNNGIPLQDEPAMLARICRVSPAAWRKLRPILSRFFDLTDGTWRQKRLEKEWAYVAERAERAKANGKRGGRPKTTQEEPGENPLGSARDTQEQSTQPHTQEEPNNKKSAGVSLKFSPESEAVVQSLDDALLAGYGTGRIRHFRDPNDHYFAQQMLDTGAPLDLICDTIKGQVAEWAAEGQAPAKRVETFVKFIDTAYRRRLKAMEKRPGPTSAAPTPTASSSDIELDRWKARVAGFRNGRPWNTDAYGPSPGEPDCRVPSQLLIQSVAGAA